MAVDAESVAGDDIEQQKTESRSAWPRRYLVAVGVFGLYSYLVMNEGAVRASASAQLPEGGSWTAGFPQIVLLTSAVGESVFGLTGVLLSLVLLMFKFGNKAVTTAWMGLALVLGWYVFLAFVVAQPIYGMANMRELGVTVLPGTTVGQFNALRAMSLFGGIFWCFALQGGQFMVGNVIRGYQAGGKAKGAGYSKARLIMWASNTALAGLVFIIGGSIQSSISAGPLAPPQMYPPLVMVYPELTIASGVVTMLYGLLGIACAITGKLFSAVKIGFVFAWLFALGTIVWGQSYSLGAATPTTLLAGLSLMVHGNPAYSASEYEYDLNGDDDQ